MTTTCVRDSIVGDEWIARTAQSVPIQRIIDPKTGEPTGDILTGPVRLAFCNLFTLPEPTKDSPNPKFGAALMFTPFAKFDIMYEEYYRAAALKFANRYDPATGTYSGLHSPFRDQREKTNFGGFTPGCIFISATSRYKPPVVDTQSNPIVDPSKVYPGVWAICSVNAYPYDDPRKKGVGFGLQSVMIIADDTRHGGGPKDPRETFAKVNVTAPIVRPDVAGMMPTGQNPPTGMPPRPGMGGVPVIPQQQWSPPAGAPVPPPYTPPVDDDMAWNS